MATPTKPTSSLLSFMTPPHPSSSPSHEQPPPPYNPTTSSTSPNPPPTGTANPGFCPLAILERQQNALPGGGMTAKEYFLPCSSCGFQVSDTIPKVYKLGWESWVDPSVNFRWESHLPASSLYPALGTPEKQQSSPENTPCKAPEMASLGQSIFFGSKGGKGDLEKGSAALMAEEKKREEILGCWICWEFEQKWTGGMGVEEWYSHIRRHFFVEGYRICVGKTGGMQRRRNCGLSGEGGFCPKIHS